MHGAPVSQPGPAQLSFPEPLSPPGCGCLQIPGEWRSRDLPGPGCVIPTLPEPRDQPGKAPALGTPPAAFSPSSKLYSVIQRNIPASVACWAKPTLHWRAESMTPGAGWSSLLPMSWEMMETVLWFLGTEQEDGEGEGLIEKGRARTGFGAYATSFLATWFFPL